MPEDVVQIEIPDLGSAPLQHSYEQPSRPISYKSTIRVERNSDEKPAEYALHILFTQFIRHTERKLNLISSDESHFDAEKVFGEGEDPQFDKILASLGHVARRKPKPVIDSVMVWRKSKSDQATQLSAGSAGAHELHVAEQKSLVSIYILSRVLIEVVKQAPTEVLGDDLYDKLEEIVFKQLQNVDPALIARSSVRRANWQLLSELLGDMSLNHFSSVEDRFIAELEKVPTNLNKSLELKTQLLIQAMQHLRLVLYPEERLEESVNFISSITKFYNSTNSPVIRDKYSVVLSKMFQPIAAVATAEVNHPLWATNVSAMHKTALASMKRNWLPSFEMAVMSLCVSPQEFFIENFVPLIESQLQPSRQKINPKWQARYNDIYELSARLIWVYSFRCVESLNATTRKIETIKKLLFTIPRKFWPMFEHNAQVACISILGSLFHLYQQYALDEILFPLLTGSNATHVAHSPSIRMDEVVYERALVAVHAFSRCVADLGNRTKPEFPTHEWIRDYSFPKYQPPENTTISASLNDSIELFGNTLAQLLVVLCQMYEQPVEESASRQNSVTYLVGLAQKSGSGQQQQKVIESLIVAILQSSPCWAKTNTKHWEVLCSQINNVSTISRASSQALRNLAQVCDIKVLVTVYSKFLFSVDATVFSSYKSPTVHFDRTLRVYIDLIETWVRRLETKDPGFTTETSRDMILSALWAAVEQIEGNGLFLLCSQHREIRQMALRVLWLSTEMDKAIEAFSRHSDPQADGTFQFDEIERAEPIFSNNNEGPENSRLIHFLEHTDVNSLIKMAPLELSMPERTRINKFKQKKGASVARLADSDYGVDSAIWLKLFPLIISLCFEKYPMPMALCRSIVCTRLVQMHDVIFEILDHESETSTSHRNFMRHQMRTHPEVVVEQWRIYLIVACTTLTTTEEQKLYVPQVEPNSSSNLNHHGRKKSSGQKITLHHQRITSARSVFKICLPLLGVANANITDSVITGLSCININTYATLLQCLQPVLAKWAPLCQTTGTHHETPRKLVTHCTQILKQTAHFLTKQEIKNDKAVVTELLSIFDILYDILSIQHLQMDPNCQTLPRYFCELITEAYTALGSTLWQASQCRKFWLLIERWSSYGSYSSGAADREALIRRATLAQTKAIHDQNIILASMEFDKRKADYSVNKAMATFLDCQISGAMIPPLLKWIYAVISSTQDSLHEVGRLAIRNLFKNNGNNLDIIREVVYRSYEAPSPDEKGSNRGVARHYFVSLVAAVEEDPEMELNDPESLLALGLFKIGAADTVVRQKALDLISLVEERVYKKNTFTAYRSRIRSHTPPVYKREIFTVSALLAAELPEATFTIFSCLTQAFHDVSDTSRRDILSALLPWIQNIDFQNSQINKANNNAAVPGATSGSKSAAERKRKKLTFTQNDPKALMVLCNLFELTVVFSDTIQHEMEALWVALVTGTSAPRNIDVVLEFLFHISLVSRSANVILFARRILLFLSGSIVKHYVVETLLGYLEPQSLISQSPGPLAYDEANALFPYVSDPTGFVSACDRVLHLNSANHLPQMSYGQLAVIFLVDFAEDKEMLLPHMANILHVCLVLCDYFLPILQEMAVELCFNLLSMATKKDRMATTKLIKTLQPLRWYYDDMNLTSKSATNVTTPENMVKMIKEITADLGPELEAQWSIEAVKWATTCPIRHVACRSFQIFRCLLMDVNKSMLADMLARLSTTVSEDAPDIQGFSIQILMSVNAIVDKTPNLHSFPQLFWTCAAALGTTKEREYIECLSVASKILDKWDWESEEAVDLLGSTFPPRWEGEYTGLLNLILLGLRSSNALELCLEILEKMAQVTPNEILMDEHYLGLLFSSFLPSFLHATEIGDLSRVVGYATTLEELAQSQGLLPFRRILNSYVRGRFWSKQDFLNQYVGAICQLFPQDLTSILVSLMGVLSNKLDWVKIETMEILKLLLPSINLQNDDQLKGLGADVVSPLLRLLQTDLVEQALEVLDQASTIVAGQMDKHILRMSLGSRQLVKEYERTATLFGIPEESGWSISQPAITASTTRNNVHSVFYTCVDSVDTEEVDGSDGMMKLEFQSEENYDYNDFQHSVTLQRVDSLSTNHGDVAPRSMDRMLTALDDLDSFFTSSYGGGGGGAGHYGRRGKHHQQLSVSSSFMHSHGPHSRKPSGMSGITESSFNSEFVDRNESISIPQLYDKKVSLILNHSLGPDPSNVSFRTSFADPFHQQQQQLQQQHQHQHQQHKVQQQQYSHQGEQQTAHHHSRTSSRRVGNFFGPEDPLVARTRPSSASSRTTEGTIPDSDVYAHPSHSGSSQSLSPQHRTTREISGDSVSGSPRAKIAKESSATDSSFRLESLLRTKRKASKKGKEKKESKPTKEVDKKRSLTPGSFQFP